MSKLGSILEEFRSFKNAPPKRGALSTALQGIKKNVVVLVPTMRDVAQRFHFMTLCLQLVWSDQSSPAFITGALISLLSMFAENPGSMIRALLNDPDSDVQLAEVSEVDNDNLKLATRGRGMERYEAEIIKMATSKSVNGGKIYPYMNSDYDKIRPKSTEDLQLAIQTVTAQIWILLTKAVTAIDTARESENRRWVKYEQQRRAASSYKLLDGWLNVARTRIAADLAVRRYMVEILIDANKAAPPKARVLELICDIGNYVSEAGMAGFFLTIKYGIETKYPALALNELQADLSTVLGLMKSYVSLGERGPFMVILEDSVQTKFSPGGYPLLWSYAMGVGAMLDRAVNNLNYSRSYLEQSFYNLGVCMVEKMEGSVNRQVADELGLTGDQISQIKELVRQETDPAGSVAKQGPKVGAVTARFEPSGKDDVIPEDNDQEEQDPSSSTKGPYIKKDLNEGKVSVERSKGTPINGPSRPPKGNPKSMMEQLTGILRGASTSTNDLAEQEEEEEEDEYEDTDDQGGDDMSVIRA
uniref:Nucleocapsid n=1 Tax=Otomys rat paramyxovirus TaxID=3141898 RepID=A0AAU7E4H8_9MONO